MADAEFKTLEQHVKQLSKEVARLTEYQGRLEGQAALWKSLTWPQKLVYLWLLFKS